MTDKQQLEYMAKAVLSLAEIGGMPDTFWLRDSRVAAACAVLNTTPEDSLQVEWRYAYVSE